MIEDLSQSEADRVLTEAVEPSAHLMSDEWKAFVSLGSAYAAHDTVHHKAREYARGPVHINSAEGFNDRIRRTAVIIRRIPPHQSAFGGTLVHYSDESRIQLLMLEFRRCAATPACPGRS